MNNQRRFAPRKTAPTKKQMTKHTPGIALALIAIVSCTGCANAIGASPVEIVNANATTSSISWIEIGGYSGAAPIQHNDRLLINGDLYLTCAPGVGRNYVSHSAMIYN